MKNINFNELPKEIKLKIIETLFAYSECHIEHTHGKMNVYTSYALKSRYADDEWISREFTKKEFGIEFDSNNEWTKRWCALERKEKKIWKNIEMSKKEKCIEDYKEFVALKCEEELRRIEAQ